MIELKGPLVSVIVPVYNVESYIEVCLNSIRQQTYNKIEIIIVEDCSTDTSRQVLEKHLTDKRIRLIQHGKNKGLSAARNTGIEYATGDYIVFVDSDDLVDTRLVSACIDCALENDAEVVTYGFVPFKDGIPEAELPYSSKGLEFKPIIGGNSYFNLSHFACLKLIRTSLIRSASLRFPVGLHYEDWPFHWHLGLSTKHIYQLPANLYLYRQRGTSITGSTGKELLDLFVVHSKVNSVLTDNEDKEIKKIFINKVRQSHWVILTRIDSEYLTTALEKAREAEDTFLSKQHKVEGDFRSIIISKIINMPNYSALYSLKLLRKILKKRQQFKKAS